MSKKEQELKERYGNRAPYRVPEGYFEHFADRLMADLPEREVCVRIEKAPWWQRYRQAWVAAACVCGLAFGGALFLSRPEAEQVTVAQSVAVSSESSFDQMADYAMYDNEDIYASLCDY